MPVFASAGAKLYIGGALTMKYTDFVVTDFDSETWTEIKALESLGYLGDTSAEITETFLDTARERRIKGSRSAGTMEIVCGIDYADAGQLAAIAAEKSTSDYAFKVEFNDAPAGGTRSERYFAALVGGASEQLDGANSIAKLNLTLWVNSNIVRVNAAEA